MIQGFDCSDNNGFDWQTISPNFKFVIIKKSEGMTMTDKFYAYRSKYLKGTNLAVGYYHFMRPNDTVKSQLDNYLSGLDLTGCIAPVLDVEVPGITPEMVIEFLAGLKQATGRKPILYCDPGFYKDNLKSTQFDCSYWIAAWQPEPPHIHWNIWQNSQYGTQHGTLTGGNLDMDCFDGTVEELLAL